MEEKLVSIVKMLLVMQKTTDILTSVSLPTEKFSTIEDLIISRFTTEKTVQLLHRSASFLASNPTKMAEWVTFVDNSFSGLLFEAAKLLSESKTIDSTKKDLVEKLKVAEEHLVALEFEHKEVTEQFETEKELKIHLAARVKKVDAENGKRMAEILKLNETLHQCEMEKIHLAKKVERMSKEFEEHRKIMAEEIFKLRKVLASCNTQKKEYLEAFGEFYQILNSLSFD
jgi:hypothetical protein